MANLLLFSKLKFSHTLKCLCLLSFGVLGFTELIAQPTSQTFTSTGTFTVPANYTATITVQAWGGGGSGGTGKEGGGGGGGAYASSTFVVTAGSYSVTVGLGGSNGTSGGNSSFASTVIAAGGSAGGAGNPGAGGAGGTIAASTGTTERAGGNGASGGSSPNVGGGGGGGANSNGNGVNGVNATGGVNSGDGGNGGNGGNGNVTAPFGLAPGGGGGGQGGNGSGGAPGSGGNGQVIVTVDSWTPICSSVSTSTLFLQCVQKLVTPITLASAASISVNLTGTTIAGTTIDLGTNGTLSISGNPAVNDLTTFTGSGTSSLTIVATSGSIMVTSTVPYSYSSLNTAMDNPTNNTLHKAAISISGNTSSPLPVTLSKFEAQNKNQEIKLTWQTSAELNNDKFVIETSTEGEVFNRIGEIDGAGTTTETRNYTFTHHTPSAGINYYRLKQVDFDGTFEYSKVIAINAPGSKDIFAFPNPAKDKITIQYDLSKGAGTIQLYDSMGRKINTSIAGSAGNYEVKLPEGLARGIYWLKVERGGKVQAVPVVKE